MVDWDGDDWDQSLPSGDPEAASGAGLIGGPYRYPWGLAPGDWVECRLRGRVKIKTFTDARIPWPIKAGQGAALVVFGDLIRALETESASAVAEYWGVSAHQVSRWRKALKIDGYRVPGTIRLLAEACGRPEIAEHSAAGNAKSLEPDIRARRDAAHAKTMKGRKPSRKTYAGSRRYQEQNKALVAARTRKRNYETGWHPPADNLWTKEQEALLGTDRDEVIASLLDRTAEAVRKRRTLLGISEPGAKSLPRCQRCGYAIAVARYQAGYLICKKCASGER